jgi:hypothetical protein
MSSSTTGWQKEFPLETKRIPFITTLIVGLVFAVASPASAVPPLCEDGSPPPCTEPEPDPDPGPTTPPPIVWRANVSVQNLSGGDFNRTVWGSWGREGSPGYSTPSGDVVWTNAAQTEGTIGLTSTHLPAGNRVNFRMRELGKGHLCRSAPRATVPATGRNIHVLLGPPSLTDGADISEIGAESLGVITPTPPGAEHVRIDTVDLVPQNGQVSLVMTGYLEANVPWSLDDINDDFTYVAKLRLSPSGVFDPAKVMAVGTDPSYTFRLDNWGSDVENAVGPKIRAAVETRMADAINARIAATPEVLLYASQGYTVSLRQVTTSPVGVTVLPSLCKVS